MKYRNRINYNSSGMDVFEISDAKSMTVPDQTLTIRQLLERYTTGGSVATFTPVYNGDEEFAEFEKMDKLDKLMYAQELEEGIQEFRRTKAVQREEAKKAAAKPSVPPAEEAEIIE